MAAASCEVNVSIDEEPKAALLVGSLFLLFGDDCRAQEEPIIKLTIYLVDYSIGWLNDDYIE